MRYMASVAARVRQRLDERVIQTGWLEPAAVSSYLRAADVARVPGGHALTVDRVVFSEEVTHAIAGDPLIELRREEAATVTKDAITIIATGPLTSDALVTCAIMKPECRPLFGPAGARNGVRPVESAGFTSCSTRRSLMLAGRQVYRVSGMRRNRCNERRWQCSESC